MNNRLNNFRKENRPALIGHRGSGRGIVKTSMKVQVRENTLDSFLEAIDNGADWIETDLVRIKNGDLFIHHDTLLPSGEPIINLDRAGAHANGLLELEELFSHLPENIGIIAEVKPILEDLDSTYPVNSGTISRLERSTAYLVANALITERLARPNRPIVSYGFSESIPLTLKEVLIDSNIGVGVIAEGGTSLIGMLLTAEKMKVTVVSAHVSSVLGVRAEGQMKPYKLPDVISKAREAGIEVICWCPNLEESLMLIEAGVDGVCVDNAHQVIPILKEKIR